MCGGGLGTDQLPSKAQHGDDVSWCRSRSSSEGHTTCRSSTEGSSICGPVSEQLHKVDFEKMLSGAMTVLREEIATSEHRLLAEQVANRAGLSDLRQELMTLKSQALFAEAQPAATLSLSPSVKCAPRVQPALGDNQRPKWSVPSVEPALGDNQSPKWLIPAVSASLLADPALDTEMRTPDAEIAPSSDLQRELDACKEEIEQLRHEIAATRQGTGSPDSVSLRALLQETRDLAVGAHQGLEQLTDTRDLASAAYEGVEQLSAQLDEMARVAQLLNEDVAALNAQIQNARSDHCGEVRPVEREDTIALVERVDAAYKSVQELVAVIGAQGDLDGRIARLEAWRQETKFTSTQATCKLEDIRHNVRSLHVLSE